MSKISEVIQELNDAHRLYGDLDVFISKDDEGNAITNYSDLSYHYGPEDEDEETPVAVVLYRGYENLEDRDWT